MADGDGRALLGLAEQASAAAPEKPLGKPGSCPPCWRAARQCTTRAGEEHYNLISALHKSVRGSDPDAALYWFARMLEGGEDPNYIARRVVRMAVEDIGLADPPALQQAVWRRPRRTGNWAAPRGSWRSRRR